MARVSGGLRPAVVGLARVASALLRRPPAHHPIFTDASGSYTLAQLRALVTEPAGPDPEVICEDDQRVLAARLLVGLSDRRTLIVVSPRAGARALEAARASAAERGQQKRAARDAERPLVNPLRPGWGRRSGRPFDVTFTTSGSTGVPRPTPTRRSPAVALQLLGVIGRLPRLRRPVVACLAPLDHGHGFSLFLLTLLLRGRFIALHPTTALDQLAAEERVDLLSGVPVQLADLCDILDATSPNARLSVDNVLSGSDRLDPALAARLERLLDARVGNAYGSTETGTVCLATPSDRRLDPDTVGRPLPGCTITQLPDGRLGVRSPMLTGREFASDRGWIGPDGLVRVTGRADGVHVSGGENVSPDAVAAYLRSLPGVRGIRPAWVDDERFGCRLVFWVLTSDAAERPTEQSLKDAIRREFGPAAVPATLIVS